MAIVGLVPRGGESRERQGVPKRTGDQVKMSEVDGGRQRRDRREGGACLSRRLPFLGPWDEPRPGDAWPGAKGKPNARKGGKLLQGGAS